MKDFILALLTVIVLYLAWQMFGGGEFPRLRVDNQQPQPIIIEQAPQQPPIVIEVPAPAPGQGETTNNYYHNSSGGAAETILDFVQQQPQQPQAPGFGAVDKNKDSVLPGHEDFNSQCVPGLNCIIGPERPGGG